MTTILFRKEKNGGILAVFPFDYHNGMFGCYAHVGQHQSASLEYVKTETTKATPTEYSDLLAELRMVGYSDNIVIKDLPPMYR